ncbi:hypothetical protein N2152v2_000900 [Parachlorella kessleri]
MASLTTNPVCDWVVLLGRIQRYIDGSVYLLQELVQAFQERPSLEMELAVIQHTLLLKLVLDAQEVSLFQTSCPLSPTFSHLPRLSLVELPAALAAALSNRQAAASEGYVPSKPQLYLNNALWLAVALFHRALHTGCFLGAVEMAGQVAGCYSAVSGGVLKSILTAGDTSDVLKPLLGASRMVLLLADKQDAKAEVWDTLAAQPNLPQQLLFFILLGAAAPHQGSAWTLLMRPDSGAMAYALFEVPSSATAAPLPRTSSLEATAISRSSPPSSRIPGRQAVAAVMTAVAICEQGLRLAARHPLSYWCDDADIGKAGSGKEPEQPWTLCYALAVVAARWLGQRLPARPCGQEPAFLISLAEEGAVLGTFKSLLGLLATQRKVLFKWAAVLAAVPNDPGSDQSQRPAHFLLEGMEAVTLEAAGGALTLEPRLAGQQLVGLTGKRCIESVATVALTTTLVLHQSLEAYERWAWHHLPMARHLTLRAQLAITILRALARRQDARTHAAVAAAGILLSKARGMDMRDAMDSPRRDMWVEFISTLSKAGTGQQEPWYLLLAALQGGLVGSLAAWAQQACLEGLEPDDEVLSTVGTVFATTCKELGRYGASPGFVSLNKQLTEGFEEAERRTTMKASKERQLSADPGTYLADLWLARRKRLLPAMETVAARASQYVVTWADRSDAGHTGQRRSSSSSSSRNGIAAHGLCKAGLAPASPGLLGLPTQELANPGVS